MTDDQARENLTRHEQLQATLERILSKLRELEARVDDLSGEVHQIHSVVDDLRALQIRREEEEERRRFIRDRTAHDTDPCPNGEAT